MQTAPIFVAQTWRRVFAYIVDQIIIAIFFTPVLASIVTSWMHDSSIELPWKWLLPCFLLSFAYQVLFLKLMGATLGKMCFGLRVVDHRTHGEVTWMQSFLRVVTDHLSFFFSQALRAMALFRFDRRHVSDWVAETQVVQTSIRPAPARPHAVLATILFGYFMISGFGSAYRLIKQSEWDRHSLTLHPGAMMDSGPEAGSD